MKTIIEDWDESILDVEDYQVERALQKAAIDAIRRARQFNTEYVISENGQVKCLKPNETEKYERAALENLDRLNRKIAALQNVQIENPELVLNDRPLKNESPE